MTAMSWNVTKVIVNDTLNKKTTNLVERVICLN